MNSTPRASTTYILLLAVTSISLSACSATDGGELSDEDQNPLSHECFHPEDLETKERLISYDTEVNQMIQDSASPTCIRPDGIGTDQCDEDTELSPKGVDQMYSFCSDPAVYTHTGDVVYTRNTPCLWWLETELIDDQCSYEVVCVPEDKLPLIGWPEGESFDYHTTFLPEEICESLGGSDSFPKAIVDAEQL